MFVKRGDLSGLPKRFKIISVVGIAFNIAWSIATNCCATLVGSIVVMSHYTPRKQTKHKRKKQTHNLSSSNSFGSWSCLRFCSKLSIELSELLLYFRWTEEKREMYQYGFQKWKMRELSTYNLLGLLCYVFALEDDVMDAMIFGYLSYQLRDWQTLDHTPTRERNSSASA